MLAITGASGAVYAVRLATLLCRAEVHLHVVATAYGRRLLADECGIRALAAETLCGGPCENLSIYSHLDLAARISSGSFRTDGMVICPCSSNTLAAVASGLADNLVTRAAHVTLKEGRRLILVPREMPLNSIEIENMLRCSRAGAIVCPANPGFYHAPKTLDDLVDFVVGRVLDLLEVSHSLPVRWVPDAGRIDSTSPAGEPE